MVGSHMVKIVGALSPFFSLDEMTRSQTALRLGLDNTPPAEAIAELRRLCANLLEPARLLLGVPLHVDGGYGMITKQAVRGFQRWHGGLLDDGKAGDVTRRAIEDALAKG